MSTAYADFLAEKVNFDSRCGFEVTDDEVHPSLFPHQRDIVRWAVAGGRRAIFAAFGLGKSVMQIAHEIEAARFASLPADPVTSTAALFDFGFDEVAEVGA